MAIATSHPTPRGKVFPKKFIANLEIGLSHPPVRTARFLKFWLPVALWMIVMFSASTNLGATKNSSRIIGPFLRWFSPSVSDETINSIQFFVRKSCHAVEYAILGLLIWRARRQTVTQPRSGWDRRDAQFSVLIAGLYAATDEFHQLFVSSRQGSIWDVLLDTAGATAGMLLLWQLGRWFKRW